VTSSVQSVEAKKAAVPVAPRSDGRPRARLLLAEDSKINQSVAIAMLGKSGYHIDAVDNGREALDAVQARAYDLVLMDVSMPEMDGLDAARAIRDLSSDVRRIPIIAMTAHAMESDREKCLAAGMNDYVTKPVDRLKLLDAVARWLGTSTDDAPAPVAAPMPQPARRPPPAPAPILKPLAPRKAPAAQPTPATVPPSNGSNPKSVSAPAPTANAAVLDNEILLQLERDTNSAILHELVSTFVAELAERLQRITAATRNGDFTLLQREAHSLKSSSGTFGALQLQAQARAIEMACREGRTAEVGPLVRPVNAMALDASRALAAWVSPHEGSDARPR
jgi:CheY-like chemotaxis protein/HPt (histidine-containing phosphotransfer) domain-containing protein